MGVATFYNRKDGKPFDEQDEVLMEVGFQRRPLGGGAQAWEPAPGVPRGAHEVMCACSPSRSSWGGRR